MAIPFLKIRPFSRLLRRLAARFIQQTGVPLSQEVTNWHHYSISWLRESLEFSVDGERVLHSTFTPASRLGVVVWIDNQYAAWHTDGSIGIGTLANPPVWLEIKIER